MSLKDPSPFSTLKIRRDLIRSIRKFFDQLDYLEVETPILVKCPGAESFLKYFSSSWQDLNDQPHRVFLRSSPELHMKRLLCHGLPRIYQFAKSFRNGGEKGDWHHPEFTMLEWYEVGLSFSDLRRQTLDLMRWNCETMLQLGYPAIFKPGDFHKPQIFTMEEAFLSFADLKLGPLDFSFLQSARKKKNYIKDTDDAITAYCRVLLEEVEPALKKFGLVVIENFPDELSALCNIENGWAKRFEIYINGIEICNAFEELTNSTANQRLFEKINQERKQHGFEPVPVDQDFLQDIQKGLPPCSGIALGLDRWLAMLTGQQSIHSVNPFADDEPYHN